MQLFENKPNAIKPFGIRMLPHIQSMNLNLDHITEIKTPDFPPWEYIPPQTQTELTEHKKENTDPSIYKTYYRNFKNKYQNYRYITPPLPGPKSRMRKEEGCGC